MSDNKVIARSFHKIEELTNKYKKPPSIAATLSLMYSVVKKIEFIGATPEESNYSCLTAALISYYEQKGLADKHNYAFLTKLNLHTDFKSLEQEDEGFKIFMDTLYQFADPNDYSQFPHKCSSLLKIFEIKGTDMVTSEYLRSAADTSEFSFNIDILVDRETNDAFILYDFNLQKKILKYYKTQMANPEEEESKTEEVSGKDDIISLCNADFEAYNKALMNGDAKLLRSTKLQMLSDFEKAKVVIDKDDKRLINENKEILALDCGKYLASDATSTAIKNLLKSLKMEYKLLSKTQDKTCNKCSTSTNSSIYCFSSIKKLEEYLCIQCMHSSIATKYTKSGNQDAFKLMIYFELVDKDIRELASRDKSKLI